MQVEEPLFDLVNPDTDYKIKKRRLFECLKEN